MLGYRDFVQQPIRHAYQCIMIGRATPFAAFPVRHGGHHSIVPETHGFAPFINCHTITKFKLASTNVIRFQVIFPGSIRGAVDLPFPNSCRRPLATTRVVDGHATRVELRLARHGTFFVALSIIIALIFS